MEMSRKEQQIPAIRFNGFTDAWEQRKLEELFKRVNERNSGEFNKSHWISVAKMYFQDPEKVQSNNIATRTYVMRKGDIAFEGHPNSEYKFGRFVLNDIGAGVVSELFPIYRHKADYDLNYWKVAIQLERVMAPIFAESITSSGNSSNKLDDRHFLRQKMLVPNIEEQYKIGTFFKQLDGAIALHQRQMDNYKELKKTSMQKIFNQELRFKDKNGNDYPVWQKKKLKDLGKFYSGTGFNDKYQGYLDLSIPFFKVSDMNIASNSKYMVESNNTVDDDICREMKINKITGPAILFAKVGAAIYMERKRIVHNDFLMDNNMMALRINDSVDIEFTYYLCQSLSFSKYAQVGALPSYNASDIGRLHCKLPVISEQKKIAIFLSILDQKVNEAAQKVELFKELKKGLMQQMFF